ncbi:hypothetical protein [Salipaludibacillus daqingensis]|uniref:hypothetical protein n=1 Tax=Salipaludibacillus daqingensis TaxID=3041001 RepID=UPI0024758CDD|nr:hypothetical protein [Salipaludibacillus daqingensis]
MKKSDLRSLSGGILVATLVLSPFILFGDDEGQADEEKSEIEQVDHIEDNETESEVTDQDIQAYIEAEGLFIVSESEYDSLKEGSSDIELVKAELEETKEELEEQKEAAQLAADELEELQEQEDESSSDGDTIHQLYLVIGSGMSSGEIAIILEDANIINDAADFRQHIEDEDLIMSIKTGNYMLDSSMSIREIADIIS